MATAFAVPTERHLESSMDIPAQKAGPPPWAQKEKPISQIVPVPKSNGAMKSKEAQSWAKGIAENIEQDNGRLNAGFAKLYTSAAESDSLWKDARQKGLIKWVWDYTAGSGMSERTQKLGEATDKLGAANAELNKLSKELHTLANSNEFNIGQYMDKMAQWTSAYVKTMDSAVELKAAVAQYTPTNFQNTMFAIDVITTPFVVAKAYSIAKLGVQGGIAAAGAAAKEIGKQSIKGLGTWAMAGQAVSALAVVGMSYADMENMQRDLAKFSSDPKGMAREYKGKCDVIASQMNEAGFRELGAKMAGMGAQFGNFAEHNDPKLTPSVGEMAKNVAYMAVFQHVMGTAIKYGNARLNPKPTLKVVPKPTEVAVEMTKTGKETAANLQRQNLAAVENAKANAAKAEAPKAAEAETPKLKAVEKPAQKTVTEPTVSEKEGGEHPDFKLSKVEGNAPDKILIMKQNALDRTGFRVKALGHLLVNFDAAMKEWNETFRATMGKISGVKPDKLEAYTKLIGGYMRLSESAPYSKCGHNLRVGQYMEMFITAAKENKVRISSDEATAGVIAGMVHDVGKAGVPFDLLRKPGALEDHEFGLLKAHAGLSSEMLNSVTENVGGNFKLRRIFNRVAEYSKQHHENIDGSGYNGLKGKDIPVIAKMIRIADSFDAITSDRPYQNARTVDMAIVELEAKRGTQYDPKLVDIFTKMIKKINAATMLYQDNIN
jgi:HD-GYP domain-containing protein (c-di-GMP phosphodiesterase class II)